KSRFQAGYLLSAATDHHPDPDPGTTEPVR
ncbi:hypothetical protein M2167_004195, partial [Streptomyces sp. SPB4]|nr:hypothetical protein [Streptomyces sp. SPB4]